MNNNPLRRKTRRGSEIKWIMQVANFITTTWRRLTREVTVGSLGIGGRNPVRIQSMTTTDTLDVPATVAQSIRMIEAGCELVRITAPSQNEARKLAEIRRELRKRGYQTPLIADIHFTPKAAEIAADIVEKVRINPGNYADRKKFESHSYTDREYADELERIRERFTPLVKRCRANGVAMRIGTNHGSLSDRILGRYGDTPEGMVESALEFVRICEELNYHNLILSLKSSNPLVMVAANRLLVRRMDEEGMNYPLHLGVTEAGEGEDGRIKSALGIGTLLQEGLGDTIRVSLTEEPEAELPVARELVSLAVRPLPPNHSVKYPSAPVSAQTGSDAVTSLGGPQVPVVVGALASKTPGDPRELDDLGYYYAPDRDQWVVRDQAADWVYIAGDP
ncbi:MAG: (E)-4-hydroxy-3-methylbut-2-enyl-diphosphate synthase, partial [Fidelibacterota bacterium]